MYALEIVFIRTIVRNIKFVKFSMNSQHFSYQIFVNFCSQPHFLACKLYARKVREFATKSRKSILGVLAVLVGVLAVLVI